MKHYDFRWLMMGISMFMAVAIHADDLRWPPHYPYRRIGTNIVDFSSVVRTNQPTPIPNYYVSGAIYGFKDGCAIVDRTIDGYFSYQGRPASSDPPVMFLFAAAMYKKKVPFGQYLTFAPELQSQFVWVNEKERVVVTNLPPSISSKGEVRFYALPMSSKVDGYSKMYDYGIHWTSPLPTNSVYYQVRTNGIFPVLPKKAKGNAQGNGFGNGTNSLQAPPH